MTHLLKIRWWVVCLCLFISTTAFNQIQTVTLSPVAEQGAEKSTQPLIYTSSNPHDIYYDGSGTGTTHSVARFRFDHPGFINSEIKEVILNITYSDFISGGGASTAYVVMPPNQYNDAVSWGAFPDNEDLYNAVNWGDIIFSNGLVTSSISNISQNLLIYSEGATGLPGQTLQFFDPNSDKFTIGFKGHSDHIKISSLSVTVSYECDLPTTAVTGLSAIPSSNQMDLNWNPLAGATQYKVLVNGSVMVGSNPFTSTNSWSSPSTLSAETSYNFKVYAINGCGQSTVHADLTQKTCSAKPTGFATTSVGANTVDLQWSAQPGYTYKVYSGSTLLGSTTNGTYTVSGLAQNTTYTFYLSATKLGYCESDKASISATTGIILSAPTITNLESTATTVTISYYLSTDPNVMNYIHYCSGPFIGSTPYGSYTVQGLAPNTTYDFKVMKTIGNNSSGFSSCESVTTKLALPVISLISASSNAISIQWNAVAAADYYEVYDCSGNLITTTTNTSMSFSGLTSGTIYQYKVKAIGLTNESDLSACFSASTIPDTPTNLIVNSQDCDKVTVSWNGVSGSNILYEIYTGAGNYLTTTATTNYMVNNASQDTYYDYKVKAVSLGQQSGFSNIDGVTTLICAPTNFVANQYTTSSLSLTWDNLVTPYYYEIYDCNDNYITTTGEDPSSTTTEYLFGYNYATPYTFKVKGYSTSNESEFTQCINGYTKMPTPTGLSGYSPYYNQANLSWNAVPGASYYTVYYCTGGYLGQTNNTGFTVNGLSAATSYGFKIMAHYIDPNPINPNVSFNGSSWSGFTSCIYVTTQSGGIVKPGPKSSVNTSDVNFQDLELAVFPTPNNGNFTARISESAKYEIYTISGEVHQRGVLVEGDNRIEVELPPGMYFIKVFNEDKEITQKVIIQ